MVQSSRTKSVHFFEHERSKRALAQWITEQDMPVFGALLFHANATTNKERRLKLLRVFWQKLDRCYFGNQATRKGRRINRHVVIHFGANGDNLHAHFIAEAIGDTNEFCKAARLIWVNLSSETIGFNSTHIEPVESLHHSAVYLLHEQNGIDNYNPLLSSLRATTDAASNCLIQDQKNRVRRLIYRNI
jgi:hypothetical protein